MIDKDQIVQLLRAIGKSERQTQRIADSVEAEQMSLDDFRDLVHPPKYPCVDSYNVTKPCGGSEEGTIPAVPVPCLNYNKLWDIPVLGQTLSTVGHLVAEPMDNYSRRLYRSEKPTDRQLAESFAGYDADADGKLTKQELAKALRVRAMTEVEITAICNSEDAALPAEGTTLYEYKKFVRGPKYVPGSMNCIPLIGGPVHTYIVGDDEIPEEDMKEAFEHVARGKPSLDKEGVKEVLVELGKSDHQISCFIPEEETKASWSFDEFKITLEGEPVKEEPVEAAADNAEKPAEKLADASK